MEQIINGSYTVHIDTIPIQGDTIKLFNDNSRTDENNDGLILEWNWRDGFVVNETSLETKGHSVWRRNRVMEAVNEIMAEEIC